MEKLKYTYCGSVGVEYMHMQDVARKDWVQKKVGIELAIATSLPRLMP